jgi:thiol-disulfide isomerase/thioredoxin
MEFRPTRRTVLALGGAAIAGSIAGCAGDSSSTTEAPTESTTDRTTAPDPSPTDEPSTAQPVTTPTDREPTPAPTEPSPTTSSAPATTMGERTTYPRGADRMTVTGVEAPGSTGGQLTVNPPDTVSLVEFFATWCGPCKDQMSHLRTLRSKFSRDRVSFISITPENKPDAVRDFWEKYDGTWRVGIDANSTIIEEFGVRAVPTSIVLLPDGTEIAWRGSRGSGQLESDIERALERADL